MDNIKWLKNKKTNTNCRALRLMETNEVKKAHALHKSFSEYNETPLVSLDSLASELGLGKIFVKDESKRFGLNAFKVLGGSYAIAKFLAQKMGKESLTFGELMESKDKLGEISFYTATDGNHGRGVAWAARVLGHKAYVYMPDGATVSRRDNIRAEGAVCEIIEGANYDECVRLAAAEAEKSDGVIVQDTAWDGYEEIPGHIMQGYGTMALEAVMQLEELGEFPTHIFIQAGVGSLAAAVLGFFKNYAPNNCPITVIVEPHAADCLYKSAQSGKIEFVTGSLDTIMAGLSCGEPNPVAWELLSAHAAFFSSCPDSVATKGMRMFASPLGNDEKVVSGESGAVGLGLLAQIMRDNGLKEFREALGLDSRSRVLLFSSEGATDAGRYLEIVGG